MQCKSVATALIAVALAACSSPKGPGEVFGKTAGGRVVHAYTLTNVNGLKAKLIDFGATLVSLEVPDRNGQLADIVLGCDTVECYEKQSPYFGAIVGRYANRIAGGKFTLDGVEYTLATNDGPNHLHGGNVGFDKVVWKAEPFDNVDGPGVKFTYRSKDGEEGYPGNLDCTVTYTLTNADELVIEYRAVTDKPTPVNLSHHSYFNLAGHDSGAILDHELTIHASFVTPTGPGLIPTGVLAPVTGTAYDFTGVGKPIGLRIDQAPGGYDINFVLDGGGRGMDLAARVRDPKSGRVMEIFTTEPGLQFYSGNFLDGTITGKNGVNYVKHAGFCLEAQKFPDSPNQPLFPNSILRPGETYRQVTLHKFYAE